MLFNLFKKNRVKESNLKILNELINTSNNPTNKELYLLDLFRKTYNISKRKKLKIIRSIDKTRVYPKNNSEKIQLVTDLCMLMCIENNIKVEQFDFCLNICKEMVIDDREVDNQIKLIISNADVLLNGAYDDTLLTQSFRGIINYKIQEKIQFKF